MSSGGGHSRGCPVYVQSEQASLNTTELTQQQCSISFEWQRTNDLTSPPVDLWGRDRNAESGSKCPSGRHREWNSLINNFNPIPTKDEARKRGRKKRRRKKEKRKKELLPTPNFLSLPPPPPPPPTSPQCGPLSFTVSYNVTLV